MLFLRLIWSALLYPWRDSTNRVAARVDNNLGAYLGPNATALRAHALSLMQSSPLIDAHVDLPQILRVLGESPQTNGRCLMADRRPLDAIDGVLTGLPGHVDIPRMHAGKLGAVFLSVWVPCPDFLGLDVGADFLNPLNVSETATLGTSTESRQSETPWRALT
jgi:hypothetical protein